MKTKLKKFFSLFLALMLMLPTTLAISAFAEDTAQATSEGVTFNADKTYTVPSSMKTAPLTFEAVIHVPTTQTGRAGVIMGNYFDNSTSTVCFEIYSNGAPRIYAYSANTGKIDICFEDSDVRSDDYVHLAITINPETNLAYCYINGKLTDSNETIHASYKDIVPANSYMIGGDCRSGNVQYFKGSIKSVAMYSDTRTADEIADDVSVKDDISKLKKDELMAAYDLTAGIPDGLTDLSGNGHTLIYSDPEYDESELAKGLTFTADNTYQMSKLLSTEDFPKTFEAELFLPTSCTSRGGIIVGNYAVNNWSMTLEIYNAGKPKLYFEKSGGEAGSIQFDEVDVRTGGWAHLAITFDPDTGAAVCYLNGEKKQEIESTVTTSTLDLNGIYDSSLYLGRDTRTGSSSQYFKGALKSVALYSDVRTESEVLSDITRVDTADTNLVAAYYFKEETGRLDISGNEYHFYYEGEETETPDEGGDSGDAGTGEEVIGSLDGLTFASSDYAIVQKSFTESTAPYTFEATVLIPKTQTDRAGVILGNHYSNGYKYLNFEIYSDGNPRLCFTQLNSTNNVHNYLFDEVSVNTGNPVHLAITLDPTTGTAICYVNGEKKQVITYSSAGAFTDEYFENYYMVLGNDPRQGGARYFTGTIGNVAVYSDTRTDAEILADYEGINLDNDNLLLYYGLSSATSGNDITDLSGNGYDAVYKTRGFTECKSWFAEKTPVTDYLYSFAVIGDTQIITQKHPDDLHKIYDWILNNKDSKNIQYVFGLGDITNGNSSTEWTVASENIFKLNGVIPHSAIRGNHDGISGYNNVFVNNEAYMSQFDGFYAENDATSTYRLITIGGVDYLMVTLDYGASDEVLNWAGNIIKAYPDRKVIITTHAYLYRDGTTLDQNDVCPPATNGGSNNGDHIWDKLISQHENIFLVISGHDPSADVVVTQSTGVHGNLITQMLVDPQGVDNSTPTGMVTMLYFKADGSIEVETYSTIQELYYKENNQFTLTETEHNYTTTNSLTYTNGYMQSGIMSVTCANEECEHYTYDKTVDPLFTFSGYSIRETDTSAICVGYTINYELLNTYEALNNTKIEIGITAALSEYLVNEGKPINGDGSLGETTGGRIVNYVFEDEYVHVSLILTSSDWSIYKDREVILCAYILENNTVGYICQKDKITDQASSVTYSEVLGTTTE